jgi:hypothetical protein
MSLSRLWLWAALVLTAGVHGRIIATPFCGFDDFANAERAQFADRQDPATMITTTHFNTSKYRPVSRIVTYACQLAENAPLAHRTRNFLFHLAAVGLVFALGRLLGASGEVAGLGAALFGVHPLAHQTISASIFTIDMAYAVMMAALCLFLLAFRSAKATGVYLTGVSGLMVFALLCYEATIIMLGCGALYLLIQWRRTLAPAIGWRSFLIRSLLATAAPVLVLMLVRKAFVAEPMPVTPPLVILKNLAFYLGALSLPVDLLLLNSIADFPMPKELMGDSGSLLLLVCIVAASVVLLLGGAVVQWKREGIASAWRALPWMELG